MALSGPRRARLALACALVAVVVAVIWGWRRPAQEPPRSGMSRGGGHSAGQEWAEGEDSLVLTGDFESQRIKAAMRVTEPDGTMRFRGDAEHGPVQVTLAYTVHGRPDKVTIEATRAEYYPSTQSGRFSEAVKVATGMGLELKTESMAYRGPEAVADTEETVEFRRKQVSGSARGMSLAIREGRLTLDADVKLRIEDELRGPVEVEAARGAFEKAAGRFELLGAVTVRQGGAILTAERVIGGLALPEYALTQLTAIGNVVLRSPAGATVRQMGVKGSSAGAYTLRARRLDMPVGAADAKREVRAGPEGVEFVWWSGAPGARAAERRLEANAATFVLDALGHLEMVQATKNVRLTQAAPRTRPGRAAATGDRVECGSGYVALDPVTGEITRGELVRDVVMTRGPLRAVGERGELAESHMLLTGSPEVVNSETGSRLSADSIRIGVGPQRGNLAAWGNVLHTLRRARRTAGEDSSPALMTFSGNQMEYDERKRAGVYRGDAILRMADDEVSARQISVRGGADDALTLHAYYNVHSRVAIAGAKGAADDFADARAAWLVYDESAGKLRYASAVTFTQGGLTIETPGRLVVWLSPERKLKQLEAVGTSVKLAVGARRAEGVHLTYSPVEDAFRLTGNPVTYDDGTGPGGRGLALTLNRGEDRILLDGRDLQRTVTTIKRGQPQQ